MKNYSFNQLVSDIIDNKELFFDDEYYGTLKIDLYNESIELKEIHFDSTILTIIYDYPSSHLNSDGSRDLFIKFINESVNETSILKFIENVKESNMNIDKRDFLINSNYIPLE